jgi:hypothetical protein
MIICKEIKAGNFIELGKTLHRLEQVHNYFDDFSGYGDTWEDCDFAGIQIDKNKVCLVFVISGYNESDNNIIVTKAFIKYDIFTGKWSAEYSGDFSTIFEIHDDEKIKDEMKKQVLEYKYFGRN